MSAEAIDNVVARGVGRPIKQDGKDYIFYENGDIVPVKPKLASSIVVDDAKEQIKKANFKTTILTKDDLPLPSGEMNLLVLAASYVVIGASLAVISDQLKVPQEQLERMISTSDFRRIKDMLVDRVLEKDLERAEDILSRGAPLAAQFMVNIIDDDQKDEKTRVVAAKDVLDRAGLNGKSTKEQLGASLTIRVIK